MKIKKHHILLGIIILISIVLRFWQLGKIPISPDWDETALGYNAYSVIQTGRDEYGKFLPIVIQSFNDYKPALYMYLSIPFIKILGLSTLSVRLASAIFGVLAVITTYFLVEELFDRKNLALLASFLLAISPWSIQFSRVAFEANVGLTLNLFVILFFLKGLKRPYLLILSAIFAALALYVYQSEKVFTPLLALSLVLIYRKDLLSLARKYLVFAFVAGLLVALPIVTYTVTNKNSLARAQGASIFSAPTQISSSDLAIRNLVDKKNHDFIGLIFDNRRVVYVKEIIGNYLWHYDPNWLFVIGDTINPNNDDLRTQATGMGNLYWFDFPFLFLGIYLLLFSDFKKKTKLLIFTWFLIVPIPASITWDIPNSVRTLNFLPTFQIFIAIGLIYFYEFLKNKKYKVFIIAALALFAVFNFAYYLDQYFVQYNYFAASYWQYGYAQLIPQLQKLEPNYDHIVISTKTPLDQSYIFFLFYLKYPPALYQKTSGNINGQYTSVHKVGKFEFRDINWPKDLKQKNILIVDSPNDIPSGVNVLKTIYNLDGTKAIEIVNP